MPHKDPDRAREYQRNYQRKRRAEAKQIPVLPSERRRWTVRSANEMQEIIEYIIDLLLDNAVTEHGVPVFDLHMKARTVASLLNISCKLLEVADFNERLARVERQLGLRPINMETSNEE